VPELGTPGSVRGVLSNGHPYRNPRPTGSIRLYRQSQWNAIALTSSSRLGSGRSVERNVWG
jgi:hypothetical protein